MASPRGQDRSTAFSLRRGWPQPRPLGVERSSTRWRDIVGWMGIVAGAAVFVAAPAVPLGDPALLRALVPALRGGRRALGTDLHG